MPHPPMVQIEYRHAINKQDQFKMLPGFSNFQEVSKGEHLADDRNGPVLSPMDGLIVMPLYQETGNDGFFIGTEIKKYEQESPVRVSVS